MTDAAAPGMGIDGAAIQADIGKLVGAGIPAEQAQAMAYGRARQLRDLSDLRGEHQIPIVDGDGQFASKLNDAMKTSATDHTWSLQPEGNDVDATQAAAEATSAARAAAVALNLSPGTGEFLARRIDDGVRKVNAMSDAEHDAHISAGMWRLAEHYGSHEAAKAMVGDAVKALKAANVDQRLVSAFIIGASTDVWAVDTLAKRYRAKRG